MSVDLKDLETTPTLSLDPFGEAEKEPEVPAAPAPEAVKPAFDESILNDDERKMVDSFAKQIDLTNNNMILQYGAGAQKKMADFSEAALENVRTKDLGEVGDMLSSVVTELKSFDAAEEQEKGFFGFFKKNANKLDTMKNKYDKAEENGHEDRESPPESSGRPHERHCNAGQDVRAEQNLFQRTFHVHSRRQEKASGGPGK